MAKTHAIRITEFGGPEKLKWEEVDLPAPGAGELLLRQTACGLNYVDTYQRSGLYPLTLPSGLGLEAAAVVEAVGPGVTGFKPGDRVGYNAAPAGAYAERRVYPAAKAVKLPDGIDDKTAAAMLLRGMTVEYLIRRTFPVKKGQTVLFHAAAGGLGLIAGQWLSHLGVTVIGTVGSDEKARIAREHGYHHVINYRTENFVARVKEITGGKGVPVVYDGVGKDVFMASLDCLSLRGMMVTFGNASGPVPTIEPLILSQKGSLFLTRPSLGHYTSTREELLESAQALFDIVLSGAVKVPVNQTYPLKDTAQAHRDLEARRTTGATVLLP
ncbi:MAG TPA: quinone oxidoreductase [Hypericibacter adhaerens]|jgi:NADPH2:quinone reductase|uniref:Quinone oxidoreductase n=1 Tax=Hypericibacter adhaerens TaxID=2602016 RepID=A0A5J6NAZ2_9PROT|nr:quinone oxidoreductase [Hypericibacter adhaerens]QEX25106.1 quinone oxidoreductase [Hypericibacter adhaerens]HWA41997.1 quinone oxidoreductase [Hypericibacter adhaerens]